MSDVKRTSAKSTGDARAGRIVAGNTRKLILDVAEAWRGQYGRRPHDADKADILQRLEALDKETASPEDVEAIIGNDSWTELACDTCERAVDAWVRVGAEPDYESATAHICADCLAYAVDALARISAPSAECASPVPADTRRNQK